MTNTVETLITAAWDYWEQEPTAPHADNLPDAIWRLEDATDNHGDDVTRLAREVVYALTLTTGDGITEILAPMQAVAVWLGMDR